MSLWVQFLASLNELRIQRCHKLRQSYRCSSDPVFLWLWCRPVTAAWIQPLAWEFPYAAGAVVKRKIKSWRPKFISSDDPRRAKEHLKKCPTSASVRETHTQTTLRKHLSPTGTATIRKTQEQVSARLWRNWPRVLLAEHKTGQPRRKRIWHLLKKLNIELSTLSMSWVPAPKSRKQGPEAISIHSGSWQSHSQQPKGGSNANVCPQVSE